MAEIRVAPERRSKAGLVVGLIVLAIIAAGLWYFLAGPGQAAVGG